MVPWPTCSLDMDPIEHASAYFGRATINRDLPLTLHELAKAPTKDLDSLDIETMGNIMDSVLRPIDDLVLPVLHTWIWWQSGIRNSTIKQCNTVKLPKTELSLKLSEVDKLWENSQFCCSF